MASLCVKQIISQFNLCRASVTASYTQVRGKRKLMNHPKLRRPEWQLKQDRANYNEELTLENSSFIKEMVYDKYGPPSIVGGLPSYEYTPLKKEPLPRGEWFPGCRRVGLIAKKIGIYPQWTRNGDMILTTLLQVPDNHVIKYIPPEDFQQIRRPPRRLKKEGKMGCLVVGAISSDPQNFTKEYCGLFTESGVMPKKILTKFPIHPAAAITPGTELTISHFRVGDYVDVSGKTINRGFQGVMKRWGFHGMPASHGVTKTHRRPGNIGQGGKKARVMPGTRLPGHMGNRTRTLRGLRIWRINYKYNVMWVSGQAIPGGTNSVVYIHDTVLPLRWLTESPAFPTYYPEDSEEALPDEILHEQLFNFKEPTLTFEVKKK